MAEATSKTPWGPNSDPASTARIAIGPVLVRLPPDAALSRVLRLAAGGIAAMAGFTVDETEDIKIAVSEALLALIEHGSGEAIEMELSVAMQLRAPGAGASRQTASGFNLRARTPIEDFDIDHPDLMLCRTVLAGVCSQHSIELVGGYAEIYAEIRTAEPDTTSP